MTTNPRHTAAYKKWVREVMTKCEPICYRCGHPIDMSLPSSNPDGPSAEHITPLAEGGDLTPSLEDSALSHLRCNRSHGGRIGAARANAKPKSTSSRRTRSLDQGLATPAAPRFFTPRGATAARGGPVAPELHPHGFVLPRLETAPPVRAVGSYGPAAAEWVKKAFGLELRGWQAYALNRALEHDDQGELVWPVVVITVGRQSGKSVLSRAVCMWRMHHADLFGEQQTILHVANKVETAREVMRPAAHWAVQKYGKAAYRAGNTAPQIELPSGDRWIIQAANDSAGVGYSISMAFVDEAWRVARKVVDDAINPTLAERNMGQVWLVSTAGDSASDLMMAYRQRALDKLEANEPGSVLLLEWSAPAEADPELPETWRWGSPEWTDKRETFLRQQWENIEPEAFRREFLNQWTVRANHWLKDSWWADTLDPAPLPADAVWSVAVESDFDGMGHAVALAAQDDQGKIAVRVSTHRTIAEVDEYLAQLRIDHPQLYVQVTPTYRERLTAHVDGLVGQREAAAATQNLLDLFDRRAIRHDGSQVLQEHFAASTISRRQAGWVLSAPMGKGGVYAARAVMFAAAQAVKTQRPKPMIYTRNRRLA